MNTDLLDDVRIDELESSSRPVEEAVTLPPRCYTSESFYEFERDAVFGRGWVAIGREETIPEPGDYFTVDLAGEPLVAVRRQDGEISVMSSVCQHRAAVIVEGRGNCGNSLLCPYHAWNYGLDGKLRGAPQMARTTAFDKDAISLPRLRVECWHGFIFAAFDEPEQSVAEQWERLGEFMAGYRMWEMAGPSPERFELEWNWKVMLENAAECYHCTTLHGELHATAPTRNTVASPLRFEDNAFATRVRNIDIDTDFNPTGHILLPPIPTLTEEERSHSTWLILPPNLFISLQHDNAHYFLVFPDGPGRSRLEVGYLYPKSTLERSDFQERYDEVVAAFTPIMEQDTFVNERVQRGLQSRFAPRGRFSWQEEALANFNRWLIARFRAHLDTQGDR